MAGRAPRGSCSSDTASGSDGSEANAIVGRTIELDRQPHTVIGVMAEDFGFLEFARLWVPMAIDPAADTRGAHSYDAIGLLRPGVSEETARTNLAAIARQLEQLLSDPTVAASCRSLATRIDFDAARSRAADAVEQLASRGRPPVANPGIAHG